MRVADSFIQEIDMETPATRRVLDRLPEDQFSWRPHPTSWSLGELGLHVAQIPGMISQLVTPDVLDNPPQFQQRSASSKAELLDALTASVNDAKAYLDSLTDEQLMATWTMNAGGKPIMAMPRAAMVRAIMLNHWYHHRGQLQVYLRMLGIPVPSVYGPTGDENPFMS